MAGPFPAEAKALFDALLAYRSAARGMDAGLSGFMKACAGSLSTPAQLYQDMFVLTVLNARRNGFFVEFGAADGITHSNTLLLERDYGWTGILAEPARRWHHKLRARRNCAVDERCVFSETGRTVEFLETEAGQLSVVRGFENRDRHAERRTRHTAYPVVTVSLADLLAQHDAPVDIDYVSVDTEGTEFEILRGFDFGSRRIKIMTIEHNRSEPDRGNIKALMEANGFTRVFPELSRFDDWYVNLSLCPGFTPAGAA